MKIFELIKEYPGSPEVGHQIQQLNGEMYYSVYRYGKMFCFQPKVVEYSPEYWKEVNEYPKITGVKLLKDDKERTHVDNSVFLTESIQNFIENGYSIIKVQISDTESFSIGDKVNWNANTIVIQSFEKRGDQIFAKSNTKGYEILANVMSITKAKDPILVTEDGKEIYNTADEIWYLRRCSGFIGRLPYAFKRLIDQKEFIYFSTKEAAEEFKSKAIFEVPISAEIDWLNEQIKQKINQTNLLKVVNSIMLEADCYAKLKKLDSEIKLIDKIKTYIK